MPTSPWDRRFFATTRGQMLQRLRRGACTVDELAEMLDLTDNAIRAQLVLLERDGLVREGFLRRTSGSRKPSQEYLLTAAADRLFPKPYDHVLGRLLTVLGEWHGRAETEAAVREVGRRIAEDVGTIATEGNARSRLEMAAGALNELGGLAEVVEADGGLSIRGSSCPLAAVAPGHAEVCGLAEAFVGAVSGLAVCARCDRGPSPRCRFDLAPTTPARGRSGRAC